MHCLAVPAQQLHNSQMRDGELAERGFIILPFNDCHHSRAQTYGLAEFSSHLDNGAGMPFYSSPLFIILRRPGVGALC